MSSWHCALRLIYCRDRSFSHRRPRQTPRRIDSWSDQPWPAVQYEMASPRTCDAVNKDGFLLNVKYNTIFCQLIFIIIKRQLLCQITWHLFKEWATYEFHSIDTKLVLYSWQSAFHLVSFTRNSYLRSSTHTASRQVCVFIMYESI